MNYNELLTHALLLTPEQRANLVDNLTAQAAREEQTLIDQLQGESQHHQGQTWIREQRITDLLLEHPLTQIPQILADLAETVEQICLIQIESAGDPEAIQEAEETLEKLREKWTN